MTASTDRVLVCVPTYDEAESLPRLLDRLAAIAPDVDVLVIDDGSPDGTGAVADRFAAADPRVHVLHRPGKGGLGAAYLAGFAWGLERGFDVLVEMDADGSHRPEDLPLLLAAVGEADLVLGTRWMPGGRTVRWPLRRRLLSRAGNAYARVLLRLPLRDITGGFRAYRSHALEACGLGTVRSQGYCFQIELALRVADARLTIREVPITFVERDRGVSKMSGAIVMEAMRSVTAWGARRAVVAVVSACGTRPPASTGRRSRPRGPGADAGCGASEDERVIGPDVAVVVTAAVTTATGVLVLGLAPRGRS